MENKNICKKYKDTKDCKVKYAMIEGCSDCENYCDEKIQEMHSIANFYRIVKNYIKMNNIYKM